MGFEIIRAWYKSPASATFVPLTIFILCITSVIQDLILEQAAYRDLMFDFPINLTMKFGDMTVGSDGMAQYGEIDVQIYTQVKRSR